VVLEAALRTAAKTLELASDRSAVANRFFTPAFPGYERRRTVDLRAEKCVLERWLSGRKRRFANAIRPILRSARKRDILLHVAHFLLA
jgi:hypothetical protein